MTTTITTFLLTVNLSDGTITTYQAAGNSGYPGEHAEGMQSAGSCLLQLQLLAFSPAIMPSPLRREARRPTKHANSISTGVFIGKSSTREARGGC
ncbi:hypothetical protein F4776DRAFT_659156 [Hypoxylon sp. NC0597]|nr:hypothetical protein F4776DRAFT_659156 [Hypoxylon sp. NC0597]